MMLVYPSKNSIDTWAALGNEGWDYESLSPYLAKFATVHAPPQKAKDAISLTYHDEKLVSDGPIQVSFGERYGKTNKAWFDTFDKHGMGMTGDMRSGGAQGAFQQPASIDPATKTRSFAGTAHYSAEIKNRKNLTVLTNTTVKKVLFDTSGPEPVATGILTVSKDGTEKTLTGSEVILCAGSLMSPQILELSGVGQKALLEKFDIPVIVNNENVGEHLQDHPIVCQSFEVKDDVPSSDVLRDPNVLNALLAQYADGAQGPMGQSNISVAYIPIADANGVCSEEAKKAIFSSNDKHTQTPDGQALRKLFETTQEPSIEYMLFPGQINTTLPETKSMADYLAPVRPENSISILTLLNHPFSRGSVHITSADVKQLPAWDPNFNSNPLDLEVLGRPVQFLETLTATAPLSDLLKPGGARFPDIKADTFENAIEIVRQTEVSDFHPAGSCSMRPKDKGGVVDNRLRVYGAKGLRVVDASIFPLEPCGNIQTTVYAVAEKAADLIKEDRKAAA